LGIPQTIVFIGALQFIAICAHTPSKQSDRCWSLLSTNCNEKTVVLITVPDFQHHLLQMLWQSFFAQVIPMRELWLPCWNTLQQEWGTYLLSQAPRNVHYRWQVAKSINFIQNSTIIW